MGGRTGTDGAPAGKARRRSARAGAAPAAAWRAETEALRPMLAVSVDESAHDRLLERSDLVFERKYDGIRALIEVSPAAGRRGGPGLPGPAAREKDLIEVSPAAARRGAAGAREQPSVRIWSRAGNDKTAQFSEVAEALAALAARLSGPIVLDGEIVAVDAVGRALPFQRLQSRMHWRSGRVTAPADAVFVAFDLIRDGREDLRPRPFTERRERLAGYIDLDAEGVVRLVRSQVGGGIELRGEATADDWEGLIAKDPASRYLSGRQPAWRKIKFVRRQEFVVGGWTEGRSSRRGFGALLLGCYAPAGAARADSRRPSSVDPPCGGGPGRLIYAGHVGSGFSAADLDAIGAHVRAIASDESPFAVAPPANEPPHWVEPSLVVEVKFSRWTADDVLLHAVFLGVRTDTAPQDVRREDGRGSVAPAPARAPAAGPPQPRPTRARSRGSSTPASAGASAAVPPRSTRARSRGSPTPAPVPAGAPAAAPPQPRPTRARSGGSSPPATARVPAAAPSRSTRTRARSGGSSPPAPTPAPTSAPDPGIEALCEQVHALESGRKRGTLVLPDGSQVPLGNLHKVFWPGPGLTKGDLVRFNLRMSPYLLPVVADRPLVMKRFPNGVDGKWFYQHRSPGELPDGVRVVTVRETPGHESSSVPYLIGGRLQTLAWMAQLAVISQDPWFSRLPDLEEADRVALDLDPMPEAPFSRVVEVARWLHDELDRLGAPCMAKTSGASGLHIYIPLPPGTPYEAGLIFCQILATIVASRHPRAATVERTVRRRAADVVYIDYLQNVYGKTLAAAYSARASPFAGVSTPLTWDEVHDGLESGLSPQDFTLANIFDRLAEVGDLWRALRTAEPADLRAALAALDGHS